MTSERSPRRDNSWLTPYLRAMEITGVPDSQRAWSIRWVERFSEFLRGKPLTAAVREDVESLTAFLRRHPGIEEWKVLRANDALRLLITAVYGKRWQTLPGAPAGCPVDSGLDPLRAARRSATSGRQSAPARSRSSSRGRRFPGFSAGWREPWS